MLMRRNEKGAGLMATVAAAAALGVAVIGGSLVMNRPGPANGDAIPREATVEYGYRLLRHTAELIGANAEDPGMRYSGSNLDCASCHLENGENPGTLSLLQATSRYPRFSGRDGQMQDMRARINGCMERSMNGRRLPRDSVELISMELYIASLNERFDSMAAPEQPQTTFVEPDRRADPEAGREIYAEHCAVCHGEGGLGLLETGDPKNGYTFPPLWGDDSYNDGAGMHRVLTASRFIKDRMPLGQPTLTNDQAYDVAAFINSQPRPQKANLEADFPNRILRPVDSPYGPYAEGIPFSQEEHKYGPFAPIRAWYREQREAQAAAIQDERG
jgi:thiosulfate dehydrogenase